MHGMSESGRSMSRITPGCSKQYMRSVGAMADAPMATDEAMVSALQLSRVPSPSWVIIQKNKKRKQIKPL